MIYAPLPGRRGPGAHDYLHPVADCAMNHEHRRRTKRKTRLFAAPSPRASKIRFLVVRRPIGKRKSAHLEAPLFLPSFPRCASAPRRSNGAVCFGVPPGFQIGWG